MLTGCLENTFNYNCNYKLGGLYLFFFLYSEQQKLQFLQSLRNKYKIHGRWWKKEYPIVSILLLLQNPQHLHRKCPEIRNLMGQKHRICKNYIEEGGPY